MEEPYEKELYNLFKSFQSDGNDELDQKGVNALCETLQLNFSQRKQLWSFLDNTTTVSFEQFRDALVYLANNGIKEETYSRDISPGKNIILGVLNFNFVSVNTILQFLSRINQMYILEKNYCQIFLYSLTLFSTFLSPTYYCV